MTRPQRWAAQRNVVESSMGEAMTLRLEPLNISRLFGSKVRVRILKILSENIELNLNEITLKAGINHTMATNHLEQLKKMQLIKEKRCGTTRFFEIDFNELNIIFERGKGISAEIERN